MIALSDYGEDVLQTRAVVAGSYSVLVEETREREGADDSIGHHLAVWGSYRVASG